jgi:Ala-tRNA(Pro) deacylase
MGVAISLLKYLETQDVEYEIISHPHSDNSIETAKSSHIPGRQLAKGILLEDTDGNYILAVIPATHHIDLARMHHYLGKQVGLATEAELPELFTDCEPGAVPALGNAYGIDVIVDKQLENEPDIFLEGGFHDELIHLSGLDFSDLLINTPDGSISRPM